MAPLCLDQRQAGVRLTVRLIEVRNGSQQEILWRHEIGVEDDQELGFRLLASRLEGASLVPVAIAPVQNAAIAPPGPNLGADLLDQPAGLLIGGVIQHLNADPV